jgi:Predicted integral membrane protein
MTGTGYLVMKSIHLLAVVLFLGNIIIGVYWKLYGDRSGDPRVIAHTMAGIIRADRWFTMPGALLLVIFGFGAAGVGRVSLGSAWIVWGIVLIVISALAFMIRLGPLQRRMLAVARAATEGRDFDSAEYARLSRSWTLWGTVATLAPIIALVLMVLKPA